MIQPLIEYVTKEWQVLKNAPATILVLTAIVGGLIYFSLDKIYTSQIEGQKQHIQYLNDTITNMRSEIAGLKDGLKRAQEALAVNGGQTANELSGSKVKKIDPDSIYQLDSIVGSVSGAEFRLDQGVVFFASIAANNAFNSEAEFEYRNYRLKIDAIEFGVAISIAGNKQKKLTGVTAKIFGKT